MRTTTITNRGLNARINPEVFGDKGVGGQIDWANVGFNFYQKGKFTVKLGEQVDIGETAVIVDALPQALKKGAVLDFGNVETVVVTFSAALINATTVGVTALSAAIPSGAILKTADSQEFVKLTADAAAGATSLTVEAIPNALEGGETATYYGGRKELVLSADAAAGATAITAYPPPFLIADDSEAIAVGAIFQGEGRMIPANTIMGRTAAGLLIPMRDAGSETAVEVLVSDAEENSMSDAKTGYGTWRGGGFYENLMPDAGYLSAGAGNIPSAWKTSLGARFWFEDWDDSRAA